MDITTLFRYKSWADNLLYASLSQIESTELERNRPMLFGNILSLLNHVYAMDFVWQCNLNGVAHNLNTRNPQDLPVYSELWQKQQTINCWYEDYSKQRSSDQLESTVHFAFIGGGQGKMKEGEILQHVINHASYHRGHIEGVMYQLRIEPPTTDIPVFLQTDSA